MSPFALRLSLLGVSLLTVLTGCEKAASAPLRRVALQRTGGTTFELAPGEGQQEHCLAYTVTKSGLMRQLTMSRKNESFHCPAGQAIGGRSFKVPLEEGPVKVFVLFTSQPVNAGSVSQQLLELADRQHPSVMELRLPGTASLEVLDFAPQEDVQPTLGEALGLDAGVDAGQPAP